MKKRVVAILIAVGISCLNFGDKRSVVAQPLEIQTALHIAGPRVVIQKPLELTLEQRFTVEQVKAQCRLAGTIKQRLQSSQNTDAQTLNENVLPAVSAFLSDAYAFVAR